MMMDGDDADDYDVEASSRLHDDDKPPSSLASSLAHAPATIAGEGFGGSIVMPHDRHRTFSHQQQMQMQHLIHRQLMQHQHHHHHHHQQQQQQQRLQLQLSSYYNANSYPYAAAATAAATSMTLSTYPRNNAPHENSLAPTMEVVGIMSSSCAVRGLTEEAKTYLSRWLSERPQKLYPTKDEKAAIMRLLGISDEKKLDGWLSRERLRRKNNGSSNNPAKDDKVKEICNQGNHSNALNNGLHEDLNENNLAPTMKEAKENDGIKSSSSAPPPKGLTEEAKTYLSRWMSEHSQKPYPTKEEKAAMMRLLGISDDKKLDGWFTRARLRRKYNGSSNNPARDDKAKEFYNQENRAIALSPPGPYRPPQSQRDLNHQQVTVVANGGGMGMNDKMLLQIMHKHQQQLQLQQQLQQHQHNYADATSAAMGHHESPSMMLGNAGSVEYCPNLQERLGEHSLLSNAPQLSSREASTGNGLFVSSDGVVKGGRGSPKPTIAPMAGMSSLATMNNMAYNGRNGSWHGTSDEEECKQPFVDLPAGLPISWFEQKQPSIVSGTNFESMPSSLYGIVGGVAKEYNSAQIPPVVHVERWRKANEPAKMRDKPIVVPTVADAFTAASMNLSSPKLFCSQDKCLDFSSKDTLAGAIAAVDADDAVKPTKIARMASETKATIACQTSPNMKTLSREKVLLISSAPVADPSGENNSFNANLPLEDASMKDILSPPMSEVKVVDDSAANAQATVAADVDTTSTNYLRSILPQRSKKRRKSSPRSINNSDDSGRCRYIKEISIPSNFSPRHSYRAAAAYSLLRTLSKELRLSPFTFQAFSSALVLPIPSRLLGEVHVRVLRVLFAAASAVHHHGVGGCSNGNMGGYYYEKFGDGGVVHMIARRRRKEKNRSHNSKTSGSGECKAGGGSLESSKVNKKEEDEYEFVRKRGGNNLSFLDVFTWPLYYQDYALMSTEENIMNVMSTTQSGGSNHSGDDKDEFVDVKSVAMTPLNGVCLHPNVFLKFIDDDRSPADADNSSGTKFGPDWAHRCPTGPLGRCNQNGRFVCCPFHIRAAVQLFNKNVPRPDSVRATSSVRVGNVDRPSNRITSAKKRGRNSNSKKKTTRKSSLSWKNDVNDSTEDSDYMDDDDEDDDYVSSTKKKSKRSGIDSTMRQCFKFQRLHHGGRGGTSSIPANDLDARHQRHLPSPSSSLMRRIRGIQVSNIEVAARSPDNKLVFVGSCGPRITPSGRENIGVIKGVFSDTSNAPAVWDQTNCDARDLPNFNAVVLTMPAIASHLQSQGGVISPESQEAQPGIPLSTQLSIGQDIVCQEIVQNMAAIPNPRMQFHGISPDGRAAGSKTASLPMDPSNQEKNIPSVIRPQSAGPPPHARSSCPPILVHPVHLRSENSNPLVVSDKIVQSVEKFFMVESSKGGLSDKKMATDCISIDMPFRELDAASLDDKMLAHMIPVQQLERGIPYHHLSLDSKLTMLEFILDDLLQVSEISDELSRRQALTSEFSSPYGVPPFTHEYEEICNADECTVCGIEGDLLCCDGCPGSFHRTCIGMGVTAKLPPGKWLCPECKIVDASKMGPLGSERRPYVGWFAIADLESSNQHRNLDDRNTVLSDPPVYASAHQTAIEVKDNESHRGENLQEHQVPSFPMPQIQDKLQADTLTNAAHVDAAHSFPLSPVIATDGSHSTSTTAQARLQVGRVVFVLPRTWPGINCPGGFGRIEKIHTATAATPGQEVVSTIVTHVDVKYLENELKTRDRGVPVDYVTEHHHRLELGTRETSDMYTQFEIPHVHEVELRNCPIKHRCKLLEDVEFLVTSGNVFARYRSTLEPYDPFDPFNLLVKQSSTVYQQPLALPKPPLPLNGRQLQELLKLLGPEICLALPWLRIPFSPQKVFPDQEIRKNGEISPLNSSQEYLRSLISHQKDLASDSGRALEYLNSYRKAPSVSTVKALFLHPSHDRLDMNNYPYPTNSVPLSATIADMTDRHDYDVSIQVFDPIKPICDNMILLERSLRNACLLNLNWGGTDHHVFASDFWKKEVEQAKSIKKLSSLLINLVDACCLKAFLPHWYKPNENNLSPDGGAGRLSPAKIDSNEFLTLSEEWSPKQESTRRKWERCQGNEIRRLFQRRFNGLLVDASKSKAPSLSKRGSKRKTTHNSKNVTIFAKHENKVPSVSSEESSTMENETSNYSPRDPAQTIDKQVSSLSDAPKESVIDETSLSPFPKKNFTCGGQCINKSHDEISQNEQGDYAVAESFKSNKGGMTAPKKNLSAYLLYQQKMRKIFRAENPGMSFGKLTKFTSAMYKSLTPEVKSRWEEAAMQDKARYVNEMSTYVPPSSMIINQEGTSSKVEYNCSKKKNYPRRDSFASPISRRRSERVNILRQEIKVLIGITEMKTDKVERAIVELKLDSLENLLNDDDTPAVYWAIAGKKLFEPDGTLPRPIVKWLARNASARAPSITYDSTYEVGETTVCHRWRKRTLECNTYEGLLHCLKFLDAHMDKQVAMTASTIANLNTNPSKSPATTGGTIRYVHTDPLTGFKEYFVVPNGKECGSWFHDEDVDLNSLIRYRLEQRKHHADKMGVQLGEVEANTKRKAPCSTKSKPPAKKNKDVGSNKRNNAELQATVNKHRDDTLRLLKLSAEKGESCVPVNTITNIRNSSFDALGYFNRLQHAAGGKKLMESDLTNLLAKAENDAVVLYTEEVRQKTMAHS